MEKQALLRITSWYSNIIVYSYTVLTRILLYSTPYKVIHVDYVQYITEIFEIFNQGELLLLAYASVSDFFWIYHLSIIAYTITTITLEKFLGKTK